MIKRRGGGVPVRLPAVADGLRIGLYGGSFDPPHPGHRHVALTALRRLGLDRVWWLVSPGNPLKDRSGLASAQTRMEAAEAVARHPDMSVSGVESRIGTVFTVETIAYLRRRLPRVRFVWIMGADSFAGLHRWRGWREIAALVPMAVVDRPGWTLRAPASPAASALRRSRLPERSAAQLAMSRPPAWVLLTGPRMKESSTAIRDKWSRRSNPR